MVKLEYKGQYVMTTEQIAAILGIKTKNILWNFDDSREFFVESEDFFRLNGEELKAAKTALAQLVGTIPIGSEELTEKHPSGSLKLIEETETGGLTWKAPTIGKRAASLMLWTRYGFMHHVKMVNTPQAWAIYKQMERVYYAVLEGGQPQLEAASEPKPLTLDGRRVWTIRQAAEHFNRTPKQIAKALSTKQFKRGTDYFVTSAAELDRLRAENEKWFPLRLTLIVECGFAKLAARYRQIKETARALMPTALLELEERLKEQMTATAGLLKAFAEIKAALA